MGTVPTVRTFKDKPDPESILTYAEWNASLYSALSMILNPPMVHVQQKTAQTIANNSFTGLNFDTEVIDTEGVHSLTVNPSRITPKTPGWYMGWFGASWANNVTGRRIVQPRKNGSLLVSAGTYGRVEWRPTASGTTQKGFRFWMPFNGTTDYLEAAVWQNSGASLATFVANDEVYPELYLRWWRTL